MPPRQYATEGLRPQTLLFTFLGHHVLAAGCLDPVATSTLIEVLDRLGVSAQAARSTLTRMVSRGYLERHRAGRRAYFGMSPKLVKVLGEGEHRLFSAPVRDLPDDRWTLLSFSIPEDQRGDRHSLRTALGWNGFGLLRNGLWIAPGEVDVTGVLADLDLTDFVEVFVAQPVPPTDLARVVAEAWDLDAVAAAYDAFLARWSDGIPDDVAGSLAGQVRLLTEWRQLLVDDPQLPRAHLPVDWPSERAYDLFRAVLGDLQAAARVELDEILDVLEDAPV
ncbi:PaaX family transcriptional regulator C-terminal domain-containing protein [Euzebya sp.]|uniref:PaaX family transcriptional regulator n=1 Tax=Euzebya sp. TaxID=1971409 RepID=UPI0035144525